MSQMEGKKAPDLSLPATGGKNINLRDFKGQPLIVYFYPKDATPGCTQEGGGFRDLYKKIKKQGGEVFGVSKDTVRSHEKFKEKQKYPFDLISDEKGSLCKTFGVLKDKSMFGKTFQGIDRSTFVIDSKGVIQKEWRSVKVKDHAQEVFDFLKTLKLFY